MNDTKKLKKYGHVLSVLFIYRLFDIMPLLSSIGSDIRVSERNRLTLLKLNVDVETLEKANKMHDTYHNLNEFLFVSGEKHQRSTKKRRVLVVGGGILGVMAAFYLYQEGYK